MLMKLTRCCTIYVVDAVVVVVVAAEDRKMQEQMSYNHNETIMKSHKHT